MSFRVTDFMKTEKLKNKQRNKNDSPNNLIFASFAPIVNEESWLTSLRFWNVMVVSLWEEVCTYVVLPGRLEVA